MTAKQSLLIGQGKQMNSKGHVFVVDDDQDIRIHLGDVLKQLG